MSLFGAVADHYVAGANTYDAAIAALSPIARWKFDDTTGTTVTASVGTNGTYANSPTLGTTGLVNDGGLSVTMTGTARATLPLPTLGTAGSIISHWRYTSGNGLIWRDVALISPPSWFLCFLGGANPTTRINGVTRTHTGVTSSSLKDGVRRMFTLTSTGSAAILYINGTQVDSWSVSGAFSTLSSPLSVGQDNTGASYPGVYDDLTIVGRVVTPSEVAALWAVA